MKKIQIKVKTKMIYLKNTQGKIIGKKQLNKEINVNIKKNNKEKIQDSNNDQNIDKDNKNNANKTVKKHYNKNRKNKKVLNTNNKKIKEEKIIDKIDIGLNFDFDKYNYIYFMGR